MKPGGVRAGLVPPENKMSLAVLSARLCYFFLLMKMNNIETIKSRENDIGKKKTHIKTSHSE